MGECEYCGYCFCVKYCNECGVDNDIVVCICYECDIMLVDFDKKFKEVFNFKDVLVFECIDMSLKVYKDVKGKS